jgi:hypothetical protein
MTERYSIVGAFILVDIGNFSSSRLTVGQLRHLLLGPPGVNLARRWW